MTNFLKYDKRPITLLRGMYPSLSYTISRQQFLVGECYRWDKIVPNAFEFNRVIEPYARTGYICFVSVF